jgi:hypothetical protein
MEALPGQQFDGHAGISLAASRVIGHIFVYGEGEAVVETQNERQ